MKVIRVFSILLIAAVLLGCSFSVNIPTVDTSTTKVFEIAEPAPTGVNMASVEIEMGAGTLTIGPNSSQLVEGTVTYNVADWKPSVSKIANGVLISQVHNTNVGIPDNDVKNDWDLKLGQTPMDLKISAGAYDGTIDLSGLSLTNLEVNDGASKAVIRFDSVNPVEMQRLVYKTGASQVEIFGLANANVSNVSFDSGAGSYTLDFSGNLQRDMDVHIASGMSDTKIIVPSGVHVVVELTGGMSNVDPSGTWTINGSTYSYGSGSPTIRISVEMAVGNLSLIQN
jgi:hypothetical protein